MPNLTLPTKTLPINFEPMRDADGNVKIKSPCVDTMKFWVTVEDGKISNASLTTDGCSHSVICGSAAGFLAVGKDLDY